MAIHNLPQGLALALVIFFVFLSLYGPPQPAPRTGSRPGDFFLFPFLFSFFFDFVSPFLASAALHHRPQGPALALVTFFLFLRSTFSTKHTLLPVFHSTYITYTQVLAPRGFSKLGTILWAISTGVPQPLLAVWIFLFSNQLAPHFAFFRSVTLGFGAGSMFWVSFFPLFLHPLCLFPFCHLGLWRRLYVLGCVFFLFSYFFCTTLSFPVLSLWRRLYVLGCRRWTEKRLNLSLHYSLLRSLLQSLLQCSLL